MFEILTGYHILYVVHEYHPHSNSITDVQINRAYPTAEICKASEREKPDAYFTVDIPRGLSYTGRYITLLMTVGLLLPPGK